MLASDALHPSKTEVTPLLPPSQHRFQISHHSPLKIRTHLKLPPADPSAGGVDWLSIAVIYWVMLVAEAARGLVLPSAWPYLQTFGGSRDSLGYIVAAFTLGRVAANIPLGYLSDKFSNTSILMITPIFQAIGHFCYAVSPSIPLLILSRTFTGFSSAIMCVCRAYFASAIPPYKRTKHYAWLSATQFIGFVVLPGGGGLLANLPAFHILGIHFLNVNQYTYPAYVLIACNLISSFVVFHFFAEPLPTTATSPGSERISTTYDDDDTRIDTLPSRRFQPDFAALATCLLINLVFRGIAAELETVTVPLMMEIYDLTFSRASYYVTLVGLVGLCIYFSITPLTRLVSDRKLVITGMVLALVGCFPLALPFLSESISLSFFVVAITIMWSVAFPLGQTAALSLFSKLLAGLSVGGLMGVFSSVGAVGRIVFELFAVMMWSHFGYTAMFASMFLYQLLALALTIRMYHRLLPSTMC